MGKKENRKLLDMVRIKRLSSDEEMRQEENVDWKEYKK
jgi:hypothetical protein